MKKLATFSSQGWLNEPKQVLHAAFGHLYVCSKDQSNEYYGAVTSIRDIIDSNSESFERILAALENRLKTFFEAYFETVEISIKDITLGEGTRRNLQLDLIVYSDGEPYSLSTIMDPENPPVTKDIITNINL